MHHAFFLDDQSQLAQDEQRLGSWVTTRVLLSHEAIAAATPAIDSFIASARKRFREVTVGKIHRPDVRDAIRVVHRYP